MAVLTDAASTAPIVVGGAPGLSGVGAYQLWLSKGNVGTEDQYLASLNGKDGTNGRDGVAGAGAILSRAATTAVLPGSAVVSDGVGCRPADPTNPAHRGTVLGVTQAGGASGASIMIQGGGDLDSVTGAFAAGDTLYIALDGTLTNTLPASAVWRQVIATASTSSRIVVNLSEARVINRGSALVLGSGNFANVSDLGRVLVEDSADAILAVFAIILNRAPYLPADPADYPAAGGIFKNGNPAVDGGVCSFLYIPPKA